MIGFFHAAFAQPTAEIHSVHPGQPDVENIKIELAPTVQSESFGRGLHSGHFVLQTSLLKEGHEHLPRVPIIFHAQDARFSVGHIYVLARSASLLK